MTLLPTINRRSVASPWRAVALTICLPAVAGGLLWMASIVGDINRVPGILAVLAMESGVIYCTDGTVVHGDGTLLDRALENGTFRCTAWKLRGEGSVTVRGATPWPTSPKR
jgi:hypothetical protein